MLCRSCERNRFLGVNVSVELLLWKNYNGRQSRAGFNTTATHRWKACKLIEMVRRLKGHLWRQNIWTIIWSGRALYCFRATHIHIVSCHYVGHLAEDTQVQFWLLVTVDAVIQMGILLVTDVHLRPPFMPLSFIWQTSVPTALFIYEVPFNSTGSITISQLYSHSYGT